MLTATNLPHFSITSLNIGRKGNPSLQVISLIYFYQVRSDHFSGMTFLVLINLQCQRLAFSSLEWMEYAINSFLSKAIATALEY